ncbi:MAG: hypothetical protein JSS66_00120 [Armatimonadetes bacterium]|nr:hypothetical protein [Armatimonadota bacterium]
MSPYTRNNSPCVQVSHNPKIQLSVREMVAAAWMPVVAGKPYACHRNNDYHDCRVGNLEYRAEPQIKQGRRKDASPSKESVRAQVYTIWQSMKQRCTNSNHPSYPNYGGRGIGFCNKWRDFQPFYEWAIRSGFKPGLTLDRKKNDDWYTEWNCRWTDQQTQCRNTRRNRWIEAFGERKILAAWLEDPRCSVTRETLLSRLKDGWKAEQAISEPPIPHSQRNHRVSLHLCWDELKSLKQWSADPRCLVGSTTLYDRVKRRGWTLEQAMTVPPIPYELRSKKEGWVKVAA